MPFVVVAASRVLLAKLESLSVAYFCHCGIARAFHRSYHEASDGATSSSYSELRLGCQSKMLAMTYHECMLSRASISAIELVDSHELHPLRYRTILCSVLFRRGRPRWSSLLGGGYISEPPLHFLLWFLSSASLLAIHGLFYSNNFYFFHLFFRMHNRHVAGTARINVIGQTRATPHLPTPHPST